MAEHALGIFRSGNQLGVAIVQRNYRQTVLSICQKMVLFSNLEDRPALTREIIDAIEGILAREKIRKPRVSLGLGSSEYLWNNLEMPPVSREDLRQIVRFEMDSHFPVDIEQSLFDVQIIESIEGLSNRVTLFTADRTVVDDRKELSDRLKLVPDTVTPVDPPIIRYLESRQPIKTAKNLRLILCATENGYELILGRNGRFISNRTVSSENPWIGGSEQGLVDLAGISAEELAGLLRENINLILLMSHEVQEDIGEIICIGLFPEKVIGNLRLNLPEKVFRSFPADGKKEHVHYVEAVAICLAHELFDNDEAVNLLPLESRPVRRDTGRILIGTAAGLLIASMVLVGANNYWATDLRLLETEARIASLEHEVNLITDINLRFSAAQDARSYFVSRNIDFPTNLDVLLETTRLLPAEDSETFKKVWLEQFDIENSEMTIRGDSDSPEGIITVLEESPFFEKVRFDGTVSGTRFTIKSGISKTSRSSDETGENEAGGVDGEETPLDSAGDPVVDRPSENPGSPTPTPEKASENGSEARGRSSEEEIPVERGPAFPRSKPDVEPTGSEPETGLTEPLTPAEQEAMDKEVEREDIEAMKNNLFNFIQERKDSGELEPSDAGTTQQADPEEAAGNFIEFLKTVADSEKETE